MLTTRHIASMVLLVAIPVVGFLIWKSRPSRGRAITIVVTGLYLATLAGVVFGGIPIDSDLLEDLRSEPRGNWVPLRSLASMFGVSDSPLFFQIGNLLLLAPLGILLPNLSDRFHRLRNVVVVGFTMSATIELGQLLGSTVLGYTYRVFQIEDIVLNTVGIALGWAIWRGGRELHST